MIIEILKTSIFITISLIGVLIVFGYIYEKVEKKSNHYLIKTFGMNGLLITGIGTVVHELSHFVMCKLFDHAVSEVKLFRPVLFKKDGVLGYVKHSYNKNSIFQRIGSFFVSIAPMLFGTSAILICSLVLFPEMKNELNFAINTVNLDNITTIFLKNIEIVFTYVFDSKNLIELEFWIFIYLIISISTHMSLSKADLRNAKGGLKYIVFIIVLISTASVCLDYSLTFLTKYIVIYNTLMSIYLILGLIFAIIGLLVSYMLYKIKKVIVN